MGVVDYKNAPTRRMVMRYLRSSFARKVSPTRRGKARARLALEPLEDRCLLSASMVEAYGQVPLRFEVNQGQTSAAVDYLSRGDGYALFLQPTQAALSLNPGTASSSTVRMRLLGAEPSAAATALDALDGRVNYLIGDDPTHWVTDVPTYGKVVYDDVYFGIDVVYYGNQRQLEYDFVVAPGADPGEIAMRFDGVRRLRIDAEGNLILKTRSGELVEQAPVIYQELDGLRVDVSGSYTIEGRRRVGFQVGQYDRTRPLIIDPVLSYSTYLGGNNTDEGIGIALDAAGNAYVTGTTASLNFPTTKGAFQRRLASSGAGFDAYVTKLSADGTKLIYSTFLGGEAFERAFGIDVDAAGNAAITGITHSTNFPTKNAFQAASVDPNQLGDAFVSVLNANGSGLLYSTYLGGSERDEAGGLALDPAGNIYITGATRSANFPTANALQPIHGGSDDAFVAKINPSLAGAASLVYSTYLDGSVWAFGWGIAADDQGNAYVTGGTGSADFPTVNALPPPVGAVNAFVVKLNPSGSALIWSTLLGGSDNERGTGIAVDSQGSAYVTGRTWSSDFPTLNAFQPTLGGASDSFITKLNFDGATLSLAYSTYLGGSGTENYVSHEQAGIAVDSLGNAYVTGATTSDNFPTRDPLQASRGGEWDAFVAKVSPTGSDLLFSTYLGGSLFDQGMGLTVDSLGNVYVAGETRSDNFPTANPYQSSRRGSTDVFVSKITF
jgi:hypothetical protein